VWRGQGASNGGNSGHFKGLILIEGGLRPTAHEWPRWTSPRGGSTVVYRGKAVRNFHTIASVGVLMFHHGDLIDGRTHLTIQIALLVFAAVLVVLALVASKGAAYGSESPVSQAQLVEGLRRLQRMTEDPFFARPYPGPDQLRLIPASALFETPRRSAGPGAEDDRGCRPVKPRKCTRGVQAAPAAGLITQRRHERTL